MRIGQKTSSETFADFTLNRIPKEIRDSLSDEQYSAIRSSLIARDKSDSHSIDIRLRVPLFLRSFYIVFFAGRDRRGSTYRLENSRWEHIPMPIRLFFHFLISVCLSVAVIIVVFIVFYKLKNFLGINIFDSFHLQDFIPSSWLYSAIQGV